LAAGKGCKGTGGAIGKGWRVMRRQGMARKSAIEGAERRRQGNKRWGMINARWTERMAYTSDVQKMGERRGRERERERERERDRER